MSDFEIVSGSVDYPITPKEHGVDYLLDRRHLWIRSERQQAILRVRHEVITAVRDFFNDQGFILADTPIFTPAACEGTTTLFPVDYFEDQKVFLAQSGQLYAEANAMALGRVYNFGPVFRAEKSKTRRHLTEFWMVEPEMAYATLDDVIDLAEGLVVAVVSRVLEKRRRELKVLERDTSKLEAVKAPFPRISLRRGGEDSAGEGSAVRMGRRSRRHRRDDSVAAFRSTGGDSPVSGEGQAVLHGARPNGPSWRSASTCWRRKASAKSSAAASVWPATTCCCSASRSTTCRRKRSSGISTFAGSGRFRTRGFGMGIERVVGWICGLEHVREAIPFPRMMYRVTP